MEVEYLYRKKRSFSLTALKAAKSGRSERVANLKRIRRKRIERSSDDTQPKFRRNLTTPKFTTTRSGIPKFSERTSRFPAPWTPKFLGALNSPEENERQKRDDDVGNKTHTDDNLTSNDSHNSLETGEATTTQRNVIAIEHENEVPKEETRASKKGNRKDKKNCRKHRKNRRKNDTELDGETTQAEKCKSRKSRGNLSKAEREKKRQERKERKRRKKEQKRKEKERKKLQREKKRQERRKRRGKTIEAEERSINDVQPQDDDIATNNST
ncbi:hypothetical protein SK128_019916, partial [Halocaridina rubra]